MDFADADASGWDECLPSVAACTVSTAAGPASIPDHGDFWRVPWEVLDRTPDSATMRATGFSLPLELTRSLILTETATGWQLSLLYTVANRGITPLPWSWAAHPLFACSPGDRILLPPSIETIRVEGSSENRLTTNARGIVNWPIAKLADGSSDDLSLAKPASAATGDKLFAGPLSSDASWSTLERPGINLSLTVRFDPAKTPYLGLWLCYAGWPEGSCPKQVAIALEPTNAPSDSLAGPFPGSQRPSNPRALAKPSVGPWSSKSIESTQSSKSRQSTGRRNQQRQPTHERQP